jgi:hypothetical protein
MSLYWTVQKQYALTKIGLVVTQTVVFVKISGSRWYEISVHIGIVALKRSQSQFHKEEHRVFDHNDLDISPSHQNNVLIHAVTW